MAGLLRLHEEILEFWDFVRETPEEVEEAAKVLRAVDAARKAAVGDSTELRVFGSRVYGLSLPWADYDVVITNCSAGAGEMAAVEMELQRSGLFDYVECISSARIPLVKCRHASTGIEVDISFGQDSGGTSAAVVRQFIEKVRLGW